jgi:pimeloyl-ACP methyl ester carboxylesterase
MERTVSRDGTTIAFDRSGHGHAIVLVSGALGDRSVAAPLAERLAPRSTVIAYDRRGRGDSGDTAPYSPDREVEDLEALIGAVGGSASLFGHSSGGVLALEVARASPGRIRKLALYEPVFIVDDSRPLPPEDYLQRLEELVAANRRGDAVEYFMTRGVGAPPESVASMREGEFWPALEALAHTIPYDARIVQAGMTGDPAPLRRWATLPVPTLVMNGTAGAPWLHRAARALADVLPDARHRTLEGQDHGPASHVLTPVLDEFLAG